MQEREAIPKKKENVSTVMLLPIIKINKKVINSFYKFGFRNSYLYTNFQNKYNFNPVYLLFEPEKLDENFNKFLIDLTNNPNYIETLDVGVRKILVVFKIPDEFKGDFYTFLRGKYSQLSDTYKKCFTLEKPAKNSKGDPKMNLDGSYVMEKTTFYHIFNRTKYLRDIYQEKLELDFDLPEDTELYDKVDNKKETLLDLILV